MSHKKELLSKIGLRLDGRRSDELRRIRCKLGVFSEPDGSAYLEQGLTKVLAAVYGPHQVRGNRSKSSGDGLVINCHIAMAVFSVTERRKKNSDRETAQLSLQLQRMLEGVIRTEIYPVSQIDVYLEVFHADGGLFAVCINATTLALINAGIAIKDYACACTASLTETAETILDVSHEEEILGGASMTVVVLPLTSKVIFLEMSQKIHLDHVEKVLNVACRGCKDIRNILDGYVKNYLTQIGSTSGWGRRIL